MSLDAKVIEFGSGFEFYWKSTSYKYLTCDNNSAVVNRMISISVF